MARLMSVRERVPFEFARPLVTSFTTIAAAKVWTFNDMDLQPHPDLQSDESLVVTGVRLDAVVAYSDEPDDSPELLHQTFGLFLAHAHFVLRLGSRVYGPHFFRSVSGGEGLLAARADFGHTVADGEDRPLRGYSIPARQFFGGELSYQGPLLSLRSLRVILQGVRTRDVQ